MPLAVVPASSSCPLVTSSDSSLEVEDDVVAVADLTPREEEVIYELKGRFTTGRKVTCLIKKADQLAYLKTLPTEVELAALSENGKDSINRCFKTKVTFKQIWIHLFKSGLLDDQARHSLCDASKSALLLWVLFKEHEWVDFRPLRVPMPSDLPNIEVEMTRWSRMFTACLLHYKCDVATAVRFVGNVHTGAHRNWNELEPYLRDADFDEQLIHDLRRVLVDGCPNYVNAESSEENHRAYAEYGNHSSVYAYPENTMKAVKKDWQRSHTLVANNLLGSFLPDTQTIPQGWVVVEGKNDRQISNGSFRVNLDSVAVNDMTTMDTEHEVIFQHSFTNFLTWIYNLRIDYPEEEIYIGDDDVSGAFRHAKWNPRVVGMHSFMLFGLMFFCTGLTFGGNTCPSNWEIIAISRMRLARYLWFMAFTWTLLAKFFVPEKIYTSAPPTHDEVARFTPAERDSLNTGVHSDDGARKSPNFDHHVDDCLYADVKKHLAQTVGASILALYLILGFPNPKKGVRDCVSWEKFSSTFTHQRRTLGWIIDSRELTVCLPDDKRLKILRLINKNLRQPNLTLRELATLLGNLCSATLVNRAMRCSYFNLQRLLRDALVKAYIAQKSYNKKHEIKLKKGLPSELHHRLQGIISRHMASVLWNSARKYKLDSLCIRELKKIVRSLQAGSWKIFIPQIIKRDPHFESFGDASFLGGGAYSILADFWFRVIWSKRIVEGTRLPPSDPRYIHINTLEFCVALLQGIAVVVMLESDEHSDSILKAFPNGLPTFPILLNRTDNSPTETWVENARTTSPLVRALVDMYGQLLERSPLTCESQHIPGSDNDVSEASLVERVAIFPSECRALFRPLLSNVLQLESGRSKTPSELGTSQSRRIHFFPFLRDMNWPENDLLLKNVSHAARVQVLATFNIYLATGHTIQGKPIMVATMKAYTADVAAMIGAATGRDPRYDAVTDKQMSKSLHGIWKECLRYETKKDKVDPYSLEMHSTLMQMNVISGAHPDQLYPAFEDWGNVGQYLGPRLREWAQNNEFKDLKKGGEPVSRFDPTKRAFTPKNLQCFNARGQPVPSRDFVSDPSRVKKIKVTFEHQKNGRHGETKELSRNPHSPDRCAIVSIHKIVSRYDRLIGLERGLDQDIPLAVYRDDQGEILFFHPKVTDQVLLKVAMTTYGLTARQLKQHYRYSSHSLRVGACTILHAAGVSAYQIKFLLRWQSDAFMEYLRNVSSLSDAQNQAVARASSDFSVIPNVF